MEKLENYELFNVLRNDFFMDMENKRIANAPQIREIFNSSFIATLLHILKEKDEEKL